jgi:hypothetical protein
VEGTLRIALYKLLLIITSCLMLLSLGCSTNAEVEGRLNEELSLHIGQTARITEENLTIEFIEIVEDSRCPRNVTCVWAGRAVVKTRIAADGLAQELLLTQPGLTDEYSEEYVQRYQLSYSVLPYPEPGRTISENDYRLLLVLGK